MNSIKTKNQRKKFRYLFFLILVTIASSHRVDAQTQLSRVSITERSDQQGYVVRFHFSEAIDSSIVAHAESNLVQMALFDNEIDTTGILPMQENDAIEEYSMFPIKEGLGF